MANQKDVRHHTKKRKGYRTEFKLYDLNEAEGRYDPGASAEAVQDSADKGYEAEKEYGPEPIYFENGEEYEPEYAAAGEEYEPEEYMETGEEYAAGGGFQETEEPVGWQEYDEYGKRVPSAKRKKSSGRIGSFFRTLLVLAVIAGLGYLLLPSLCVKIEMTVEAGENCPKVSEFLNWKNEAAFFVSEINENTVMNHVGDYGVIIRVYGRNVAAVLHVRDTVAPEVTARDLAVFGGESVAIEDFVEQINDVTDTTVRFKEEPDFAAGGVNEVVLLVEDEGGNVTEVTARLEVIYDTEPPVIQGVKELTMTAGTSISYKKGVTVTDNYDENVALTVDTSAANTSKPGNYPIVYKAVDSAGNETTVSTILHVKAVTVDTVTEEIVNAEADKILESIFEDGMSQYEQARAIYDWCHDKIAYSDGTPKTNWIQGAYRGLVNRKGDCYVYAMTAKCLLTRAGITNMDIEKIQVGNSMHYWNLIDIGDGWHHFDTCRRADGSTFFYKTDAELMEYSNAHNGTHNYDRSLYPEIP